MVQLEIEKIHDRINKMKLFFFAGVRCLLTKDEKDIIFPDPLPNDLKIFINNNYYRNNLLPISKCVQVSKLVDNIIINNEEYSSMNKKDLHNLLSFHLKMVKDSHSKTFVFVGLYLKTNDCQPGSLVFENIDTPHESFPSEDFKQSPSSPINNPFTPNCSKSSDDNDSEDIEFSVEDDEEEDIDYSIHDDEDLNNNEDDDIDLSESSYEKNYSFFYDCINLSKSELSDKSYDEQKKIIESYFKKAALKCHPDKGGSNEAMSQLNIARQILLNNELKQAYDKYGFIDSAFYAEHFPTIFN